MGKSGYEVVSLEVGVDGLEDLLDVGAVVDGEPGDIAFVEAYGDLGAGEVGLEPGVRKGLVEPGC